MSLFPKKVEYPFKEQTDVNMESWIKREGTDRQNICIASAIINNVSDSNSDIKYFFGVNSLVNSFKVIDNTWRNQQKISIMNYNWIYITATQENY